MKYKKKYTTLLFSSLFVLAGCSFPQMNVPENGGTSNKNLYTVTWVVDEKTYSEKYYEGEMPVYKFGTNKPSDNTYTYEFNGWDKEIVKVYSDVTYTAQYSKDYIDYTYTWIVGDEEYTETYHYGDTPTFKESTPTKEGNDQYSYEFSGWDKQIDTVTGDEVLEAQFDEILNQYDITFEVNGVSTTTKYYYGEMPIYNGTPSKEADGDYYYAFTGWSSDILPVTCDMTYVAQFDKRLLNSYTVNFFDFDGNILSTQKIKAGSIPEYNGSVPSIKDNENNIYDFAGWLNRDTNESYNGELPAITNDTNYYAYSKELGMLTINLIDSIGNVTTSYEKILNNSPYIYEVPQKNGLVPSLTYVKGSMYLSATYDVYYSEEDVWDGNSISSSLSGSGTNEDPYLITSGADLAYIRKNTSSGNTFRKVYFKQTRSINLNNNSFMIEDFEGIYDGNHYAISGLDINNTSANTGLFRNVLYDGKVQNIITYGNIIGAGVTGSIVGNLSGQIENCTNYATVTGNGQRGGIVGLSASDIVDCTNYGDVLTNSSNWNVGGIVGQTSENIIGCINNGNVSGGTSVGGIYGESNIEIVVENCINNGDISGTWGAGGIVGSLGSSVAKNVRNYGDVNGTGQIGGITGKSSGYISYAYNLGSITSSTQTGGIVGQVAAGEIHNSENHGIISSESNSSGTGNITGGIAGQFNGLSMSYCDNYGKITGTNTLGGIVGKTWNSNKATFFYCNNYGEINSSSYLSGGLFGTADVCEITECINYGNVYSTADCAGGLAGAIYADATITDCINNGEIKGTTKLAGLVYSSKGTISSCTNNGNILLTTENGSAASDMLVYTNNGTVNNCKNYGTVSKI